MSVLLGIVFIGASVALAQNWELVTVTIYAFFAGVAAILVGLRIITLGVTTQPILSGLGFILSGLGGVCATPALLLRTNRTLRLIGTIGLVAAGSIWAFTACVAIGAIWINSPIGFRTLCAETLQLTLDRQ